MLTRQTLFAAVLAAVAGLALAQDARREREVEVELALPRTASGALDRAALEREIRARFAAGATEIQFRERTFTEAEARQLLLERNLLGDIAGLIPNDGVERSVRLRGAVDARVQRNEEGELRARIEDINVGNLNAAQRAALAERLAKQSGFERVRIRGTTPDGERVRVEFRGDRGIVRNEARGERGARDRADRMARTERAERAERTERPERSDRSGRH